MLEVRPEKLEWFSGPRPVTLLFFRCVAPGLSPGLRSDTAYTDGKMALASQFSPLNSNFSYKNEHKT
jgi:hypothetical protein